MVMMVPHTSVRPCVRAPVSFHMRCGTLPQELDMPPLSFTYLFAPAYALTETENRYNSIEVTARSQKSAHNLQQSCPGPWPDDQKEWKIGVCLPAAPLEARGLLVTQAAWWCLRICALGNALAWRVCCVWHWGTVTIARVVVVHAACLLVRSHRLPSLLAVCVCVCVHDSHRLCSCSRTAVPVPWCGAVHGT